MADAADSIERYREILELDPGSRVFALLAERLCDSGQWEQAAEVLRKGLSFHPDHLGARMLLGRVLMETGDAEESERIVVSAVEEIRKNAAIFKLLSEHFAMAGKEESSGKYARIYEAFQNPGAAEQQRVGTADSEPVSAEAKEVSPWDDFKAEAIEKLDADFADDEQELGEIRHLGFGDVLTHLAQRLEGRSSHISAPGAILSESDKEMLKERLVALLGV